MNILVTRPKYDATPLAEALRARGHTPILAPLLSITLVHDKDLQTDGALDGVQALLFTSANGVRALVHQDIDGVFALPVYAVGDASARAASDAGFATVKSAGGDVDDLAALIQNQLAPDDGALLHVAGSAVAGDLAAALGEAGFNYRRAVLYRARKAGKLPRAAKDGFASGEIDGVAFFSPRTAQTFANLITASGVSGRLDHVTAYCLSPAVADAVADLNFGAVRVAAQPTQDALLNEVDADHQDDNQETRVSDKVDAANDTETPTEGATPDGAPDDPQANAQANANAGPGDAEPTDGSDAAPGHPHSGLRVVIMVLALLAVLAGGGYATTDLWFPAAEPYLPEFARSLIQPQKTQLPANLTGAPLLAANGAPPKLDELQGQRDKLKPEIDALLGRVQSLESELENLRKAARIAAPQTATSERAEEFQKLSDRLARLEGLSVEGTMPEAQALNQLAQRVARLESQGKTVGFGDTLGKLSQRLDQLEVESAETAQSNDASRSFPAVVLAVGQLRETVLSSLGFAAELESVVRFSDDDASLAGPIAVLTPFKSSGIPSLVALRRSFDSHQDAIIRAALADTGTGWLDKTLTRVASVVSVRRTGDDLSGDGVDAVVARAEAALVIGDLASAVKLIEALDGAPLNAAKPWLTLAEQRLAAEKALAVLHRYAISLIADKR